MKIKWRSKDLGGNKMKDKAWYMSKTVWAGVIIAVYGIINGTGIYDLSPYTELIITAASGLGIVGIRSAIANKK